MAGRLAKVLAENTDKSTATIKGAEVCLLTALLLVKPLYFIAFFVSKLFMSLLSDILVIL
jgi:hypothetical protein